MGVLDSPGTSPAQIQVVWLLPNFSVLYALVLHSSLIAVLAVISVRIVVLWQTGAHLAKPACLYLGLSLVLDNMDSPPFSRPIVNTDFRNLKVFSRFQLAEPSTAFSPD